MKDPLDPRMLKAALSNPGKFPVVKQVDELLDTVVESSDDKDIAFDRKKIESKFGKTDHEQEQIVEHDTTHLSTDELRSLACGALKCLEDASMAAIDPEDIESVLYHYLSKTLAKKMPFDSVEDNQERLINLAIQTRPGRSLDVLDDESDPPIMDDLPHMEELKASIDRDAERIDKLLIKIDRENITPAERILIEAVGRDEDCRQVFINCSTMTSIEAARRVLNYQRVNPNVEVVPVDVTGGLEEIDIDKINEDMKKASIEFAMKESPEAFPHLEGTIACCKVG